MKKPSKKKRLITCQVIDHILGPFLLGSLVIGKEGTKRFQIKPLTQQTKKKTGPYVTKSCKQATNLALVEDEVVQQSL